MVNRLHGEYKQPGGKLVVVDLVLTDGRMRQVQLSGDFFLAPDEALGWLTSALEGQPADLAPEHLAATLAMAAAGAELLGVSPAGIATAVRRAVDTGAPDG
jgi:lipoate-protein ligase A